MFTNVVSCENIYQPFPRKRTGQNMSRNFLYSCVCRGSVEDEYFDGFNECLFDALTSTTAAVARECDEDVLPYFESCSEIEAVFCEVVYDIVGSA